MLSFWGFLCSVSVVDCVIGLSQIFSFFSLYRNVVAIHCIKLLLSLLAWYVESKLLKTGKRKKKMYKSA